MARAWRLGLCFVAACFLDVDCEDALTEWWTNKGFQIFTIQQGSLTRAFSVYVPSSVTPTNPASGLVMFFHGYDITMYDQCAGFADGGDYAFDVVPEADAHNFIAVCPQGLRAPGVPGAAEAGWNLDVCCGYSAYIQVDDVGFVSDMLDKLQSDILPKSYGVAYPSRNVFAAGFSTGGLFSYRLACELSSKIDGVAPSGATFDWAFGEPGTMDWAEGCASSISVWSSVGTKDGLTTPAQAVSGWVQYSEQVLGCSPSSCTRSSPVGSSTVECYEYPSCDNGAKSKLCLYDGTTHVVKPLSTVHGHGHVREAWDFLTSNSSESSGSDSCPDASSSSRVSFFGMGVGLLVVVPTFV